MKHPKRLLGFLIFVLLALLVAAGVSYFLAHSSPAFKKEFAWTNEQRSQLANSARQKIFGMGNKDLIEIPGQQPMLPPPSTQPDSPKTITFSDEEVNAALADYFIIPHQSEIDAYATDLAIYLRDGQIIIGGHPKDVDTQIYLFFRPSVDAQGNLHFTLDASQMNRMPLPTWILTSKTQQITDKLERDLPAWQSKANVDFSTGFANDDAVKVAASKLLLQSLHDLPSDDVLFVFNGKWVPLKLTDVQVKEDSLSMSYRPLTQDELKTLQGSLKTPYSP